jgi:hypothetical protein
MKRVYIRLDLLFIRTLCWVLLSLPLALQATHYTTLTDGNYYNVTNVWSTDGSTPCFCSPTDTISGGDTLDIYGQIMLASNLVVRTGGVMRIFATGTVYGNFNLLLIAAVVRNDGILQVASLTQQGSTSFISTNTLNINPGDLVIQAGSFRMGASSHVGGSVFVGLGSNLIVLANGVLVVDGNYFNNGQSNFRAGTCITILGDLSNTHVISGSGHVGAQGNITNMGDWVTNVSWCAGGVDTGLPNLEDCVACGPLPVAIGKFEADYLPDLLAAELRWNSILESNNDAFLLARSIDGNQFEALAEAASTAPNGGGAIYSYYDESAPEGEVWYQLSQRDKEGNVSVLATQRIFVSNRPVTNFVAWPNPFSQAIHFRLDGDDPVTVRLHDLSGRLVMETVANTVGEFDGTTLPAGMYLLEYHTPKGSGKIRVVKQ